jgi:serine O-acetyltransferase
MQSTQYIFKNISKCYNMNIEKPVEKFSLSCTFKYIRSDLYRYAGEVGLRAFWSNFLLNRSFQYSFWLRLCKSRNVFVYLFARLIHAHLSKKFLIQIPVATNIGYGLYIGHHMCMVISSTATIGNNCNLSQFLTIGTNNGSAAMIGDNVYIGPGVSLVENITVGSNSTIGAGAVVTRDVPDNSTVAGCPASVISMTQPGRFIKNKWSFPKTENDHFQ